MPPSPANFDYVKWLGEAQQRVEFLKQQRSAIDQELSSLEQGIASFARLVNQTPQLNPLASLSLGTPYVGQEGNLTEAVRQIFRNDARVFAPTQIRDELLNRGVRLEQSNPMAVIHQILSRLVVSVEIVPVTVNGKACYQSKFAAALANQFSGNPLAGKKIK